MGQFSYIKSFVSTFLIDRVANTKEMSIKIAGNMAFPANEKSPIFACVRKISKNEELIVAFDDFIVMPTNKAMKLILTIITDFTKSWM